MRAGRRPRSKGLDRPLDPNAVSAARLGATSGVIEQKTAEGIVGIIPCRGRLLKAQQDVPRAKEEAAGNSHSAKSPTGGAAMERAPTQPALHDSSSSPEWSDGAGGGSRQPAPRLAIGEGQPGAPGVDGMTVDELASFARKAWPALRQTLLDGRCSPQPVRRFEIPKPSGLGGLPLQILTALARLIAQAI